MHQKPKLFLLVYLFYPVIVLGFHASVFAQDDQESVDIPFESYRLADDTSLIDYPGDTPTVVAELPSGDVQLYIHKNEILLFDESYFVLVTTISTDQTIEGYLDIALLENIELEDIRTLHQIASGYRVYGSTGNVNVRALPESSATRVDVISTALGSHSLFTLHEVALQRLSVLFTDITFSVHPEFPVAIVMSDDTFESSRDIWMPVLLDENVTLIDTLEASQVGFVALRFADDTLSILQLDETLPIVQVPIVRVNRTVVGAPNWEPLEVGYGRGYGFFVTVAGEVEVNPIPLSDNATITANVPVAWLDASGNTQTALLPTWIQNGGEAHRIRERSSYYQTAEFSETALINLTSELGITEGQEIWITVGDLEAIQADTWGNTSSIGHDNYTVDEVTGRFMSTRAEYEAFRTSGDLQMLASAPVFDETIILIPWTVVTFETNRPVISDVCDGNRASSSEPLRQNTSQIIYADVDGNVCIVSSTGQNNRLVYSAAESSLLPLAVDAYVYSTTISDDSRVLLIQVWQDIYSYELNDTSFRITVATVNLDTGEIFNLIDENNIPLSVRSVALSPTGDKIIYAQDNSYTILDVDGSNPIQISSSVGGGVSWSPDGTKIAFIDGFSSFSGGTHHIYTMNVDGTGRRRVAEASEGHLYRSPVWSPDGIHIVYYDGATQYKQTAETYLVNTVTGEIRNLAPFGYYTIVWSPDGNYLWNITGTRISLEDGEIHNLTSTGVGMDFDISSDGQHVVYQFSPLQSEDVYFSIIDAVTLEPIAEIRDAEWQIGHNAFWSPDNRGIYFQGFNNTIQYVNVDGSGRREVIPYQTRGASILHVLP